MKAVIQRVNSASVSVGGRTVAKVSAGYFVLLGIHENDQEKQAILLAEKLSKIRLMADSEGKMNLSLIDSGGECLVVSQFTLNADNSGGNRPSFIKAAKPEIAQPLYELFISRLKENGFKIETGEFGKYMSIKLELDGPVTIVLEENA